MTLPNKKKYHPTTDNYIHLEEYFLNEINPITELATFKRMKPEGWLDSAHFTIKALIHLNKVTNNYIAEQMIEDTISKLKEVKLMNMISGL
jgi:hypothetical protein